MIPHVAGANVRLSRFHLDPDRLDELASAGRTVAIALLCYLVAVFMVNLWAKRSRNRAIRRFAKVITPRFIGLVFAAIAATASPVGAQVNASGGQSAAGATNQLSPTSPVPVMTVIDAPPGAQTSLPWMDSDGSGPLGSDGTLSGDDSPPVTETGDGTPTEHHEAKPASNPMGPTHVVATGEHLWSIAEAVLVSSGAGGDPTDAEITEYWNRLIDVNRAELVDPGNPDLIMPGQVFMLPPTD